MLPIADVIRQLSTLPGDWRVCVSMTGHLAVVAPNKQVTHSLRLDTGELRPLVGDMSADMQGVGGLKQA